jgi:hypothetical protein
MAPQCVSKGPLKGLQGSLKDLQKDFLRPLKAFKDLQKPFKGL